MCTNYAFDADFAAHLIKKLKEMHKSDGSPFIRNGVTLPFLAYAYKCLNNDSSTITEEYLWSIITSLENANDVMFLYQHCSDIEENVIALMSELYEGNGNEQGFYTRIPNSAILYDPCAFATAPLPKEVYERYKEVLLNKTFSRVYKEHRHDWDVVSEEEDVAINTIINDYNPSSILDNY